MASSSSSRPGRPSGCPGTSPEELRAHKKALARASCLRHREKRLAAMREYHRRNPSRNVERVRKWRKENLEYSKEYMRRYHRRRKYGLGPQDYAALLAKQGGHCALCESTAKLVVDHDHETGAVRGILCAGCNRLMATVDRPEWMEAATAYRDFYRRRSAA